MNERSRSLQVWLPRILAILVCLFLSLFALDAVGASELAVHLAPTLVLLAIVAISWRWEWVGGLVFTALAFVYAYVARDHASWVAVISGPLLIVGVSYLWSWRYHGRLRAEV
jgi:hypothetical protein